MVSESENDSIKSEIKTVGVARIYDGVRCCAPKVALTSVLSYSIKIMVSFCYLRRELARSERVTFLPYFRSLLSIYQQLESAGYAPV